MMNFREKVTWQIVFLTRMKSTGLNVVKEVHSLFLEVTCTDLYTCLSGHPSIHPSSYLFFIYLYSFDNESLSHHLVKYCKSPLRDPVLLDGGPGGLWDECGQGQSQGFCCSHCLILRENRGPPSLPSDT